MAISHLLEALTDDLNTTVSALNLPEGTNYSTIARMARNGEITTGGGSTDIYKVASIAERDALTGINEDDICVVCSSSSSSWQSDTEASVITFPKTVVSGYMPAEGSVLDTNGNWIGNFSLDESFFTLHSSNELFDLDVTYESYDGETYNRTILHATDSSDESIVDGDTVTLPINIKLSDFEDAVGYFMQIEVKTFGGIFTYKNNNWENSYVDVDIATDGVINGLKVYTNNGFITGTLGATILQTFNDNNAYIYGKSQLAYNNMVPRVLTDNDKNINKEIYIIPTKFDGTPLLDTSSVTNMYNLFGNCKNLMYVPSLDFSSCTNVNSLFSGCTSLVTTAILDFGNDTSTTMQNMFRNCKSLVTVPLYDTSKIKTMINTFYYCTSLISIPQFNTSKVNSMQGAFQGCQSLVTVPVLNTSSINNSNGGFNNAFNGCLALSDTSLDNILQMCINATSYTGTKTLKTLGISNTTYYPASRIQALSHYQDFVNAGWTIGY